jgi:hypothetical protein
MNHTPLASRVVVTVDGAEDVPLEEHPNPMMAIEIRRMVNVSQREHNCFKAQNFLFRILVFLLLNEL